MKKKTLEELNELLRIYKKAREEIAVSLFDYIPNETKEKTLLQKVNQTIKELEEKSLKFTEKAIKREYKDWIKDTNNKLESIWVETIWKSLTTIDNRAIEFLISDTSERLIIASRWIKNEVINKINQIKQNKIRELLNVWLITWESTEELTEKFVKEFKNEWISSFIAKDWRKLKLENYWRTIIRNNIAQAHNTGSYNRYIESWIKVVQYSIIWDSKVSEICRPREGKYYYIDTIEPLPWGSHFNCRHTLLPVINVPDWVPIYSWYWNEISKRPWVVEYNSLDTWEKEPTQLEIKKELELESISSNEVFFAETEKWKMFWKKWLNQNQIDKEKISSFINNKYWVYSPKTINIKWQKWVFLNKIIDWIPLTQELIDDLNDYQFENILNQRLDLWALDFITWQIDRHDLNILINKRNKIIAIDNDVIEKVTPLTAWVNFFHITKNLKSRKNIIEIWKELERKISNINTKTLAESTFKELWKNNLFIKELWWTKKWLENYLENNKKESLKFLSENDLTKY